MACVVCSRVVKGNHQALECDGCARWQHRTCHNTGKITLLLVVKNFCFCSTSAPNVSDTCNLIDIFKYEVVLLHTFYVLIVSLLSL